MKRAACGYSLQTISSARYPLTSSPTTALRPFWILASPSPTFLKSQCRNICKQAYSFLRERYLLQSCRQVRWHIWYNSPSRTCVSHIFMLIGPCQVIIALTASSDEGAKCSAWLPETIMDTKIGGSQDPNEAAWSLAYNTTLSLFPWYELPENAHRLKRFSIAMQGAQNMSSPSAILEGM